MDYYDNLVERIYSHESVTEIPFKVWPREL
jgi:hypothetical protein